MAQNGSGTFAYAPDIKVFIRSATYNNGNNNNDLNVVDISEDILSFTVNRVTNATSTADFIINNKGWKYTPGRKTGDNYNTQPIINTMDPIVIYLKRINYLQVFTGYVTYAPIITLLPSPIEVKAHCSIYTIQNTFWEIGLPEYQAKMPGMQQAVSDTSIDWSDGGTATGIKRVLNEVVNWGTMGRGIHVAGLSPDWLTLAQARVSTRSADNKQRLQVGARNLLQALDGAGIINGQNVLGANNNIVGETAPANIQPWTAIPGGQLTRAVLSPYSKKAKVVAGQTGWIASQSNSQGDKETLTNIRNFYRNTNNRNTKDVVNLDDTNNLGGYWCVIDWPYPTAPANLVQPSINWLADDGYNGRTGRRILLTNTQNGNQIVVAASFTGNTDGSIILGKDAWQALAGDPQTTNIGGVDGLASGDFYTTDSVWVTANFIKPKALPLGKVDSSNLKYKLNAAGYSLTNSAASTATQDQTITSTQATDVAKQAVIIAKDLAAKNTPYVWGGGHKGGKALKKGYDCAGLVLHCYIAALAYVKNHGNKSATQPFTAGTASSLYTDFGGLHLSIEVTNKGDIKADQYQKLIQGDLLFWGPSSSDIEHVSIYVGNGKMVQALGGQFNQGVPYTDKKGKKHNGDPKAKVYLTDANLAQVTSGSDGYKFIGALRPTGNTKIAVRNSGGGVTAGVETSPFNTDMTANGLDEKTYALFGSSTAIATNEPVLSSIVKLVNTSLRCFSSAPNGDFIAWFPDYFGVFGKNPVFEVRDVEIIDFKLHHDDTQLTTHVAVTGDPYNMGTGVTTFDWLDTAGLISVDNPKMFELIFGYKIDDLDKLVPGNNGQYVGSLKNRYGIRPYVEEVPQIKSHQLEVLYAMQTFHKKWAQQYEGQLMLTFMPEIFPGMRIQLSDQDPKLEMYVETVTHQGSREGGFSTEVTVTCPVIRVKNKDGTESLRPIHFGLPIKNR